MFVVVVVEKFFCFEIWGLRKSSGRSFDLVRATKRQHANFGIYEGEIDERSGKRLLNQALVIIDGTVCK